MRSTFMGLETAKRGMYTQQSAIYVTGHNIANKNTPGYTRQRVNFEQTTPYPAASMNRPQIPGQLGTGVVDGTIQRIRDSFVDEQFRSENNKFGYYSSLAGSIRQMEDIMNEPSDNGLSKAMAQFWQSLQDLTTNPENDGARRVVIQRGEAVAETFRYLHSSITQIQKETNSQIDSTVLEINSLAKQIATINQQISEVEPHGYLPNDLYDERDRLIDQLSSLVPVETKPVNYGGNSLAIAEGGRSVSILVKGNKVELVSDKTNHELKWTETDPRELQLAGETFNSATLGEGKGKLSALFEANETLYPEMINKLNDYANSFAQVFNAIHSNGFDIEGNKGDPFFTNKDGVKVTAANIKVAITEPSKIAASLEEKNNGNGGNALYLAEMKDYKIVDNKLKLPFKIEKDNGDGTVTSTDLVVDVDIESGTLQSFYEGVIGQMAVKGQQANRLEGNTGVLLNSVDKNRKSISEVSLDEEFSNLIQFQHAYSASARMITTIDEMLEKIINGMGTVGR